MAHHCFFGGGTAIALSHGEYRESVDVDFMISDKAGFRDLRQMLTGGKGISSITHGGLSLSLSREIRADQYGIRTMLSVGDVDIKFEIVLEGRITFEAPGAGNRICGVATLTQLDMAATKLLANSDRWSDDSVFSRDVIDLAMLDLSSHVRREAIAKASAAYGESISRDLKKAVERLSKRRGRLDECMTALKMGSTPEAVLWSKIRDLVKA
jgi:hypothetical protein